MYNWLINLLNLNRSCLCFNLHSIQKERFLRVGIKSDPIGHYFVELFFPTDWSQLWKKLIIFMPQVYSLAAIIMKTEKIGIKFSCLGFLILYLLEKALWHLFNLCTFNPRRHKGGGGQCDPPLLSFWLWVFVPWPITKSFGTTVPCLLRHLLTLIKWRHNWWQHHNKSHNLCVDYKNAIFR